MAKNSKIEWTHHTFNPWWGCERVSPACKHCYAETWAHRLGMDLWSKGAPRRPMGEAYWKQPLAWDRHARAAGERARVFCASMADVFEDRDDLDAIRARLWALIAATPHLDWLLLTKRPHIVAAKVPWGAQWPHNVWLGTTVENQRWAQRRVPSLLQYPARVRSVSCEPLLSRLDLTPWLPAQADGHAIDWVICGGESGHRARPMNPDWARALRDQCAAYGAAFHFKQWGNWRPSAPEAANVQQVRILQTRGGAPVRMVNVGKKLAGRMLDEREWDGVPAVQDLEMDLAQ
jgi:protein gp37